MGNIDPRMVIEGLITLILSITVHEFGHAIVADKLGDRLPRQQGRVTLNPLAHADPIGTLLLPGLALVTAGAAFGWGRPVQVNPLSFTRKLSMRVSHLLVAAAGPAMNILFGLFISLILLALVKFDVVAATSGGMYGAMCRAIVLNFVLAFFNLIPAPPLDGGTVLAGILPTRFLPAYNAYAPYGIFVLFAFLLIHKLQLLFLVPAYYIFTVWTGGVLGLPLILQ